MKYYRAIDYIQWIWKTVFDIDKSKSQIRRDLEQGSVKLNDRKIKVDDVFSLEDGEAYVYPPKKEGIM